MRSLGQEGAIVSEKAAGTGRMGAGKDNNEQGLMDGKS